MNWANKIARSAVRRSHAENYLLLSLIAFGVTVVAVRIFLQITGFPQIGNDVLHIAHALWGGLLLFAAALLPLLLVNRWALQASALLSGVGIGLFIDEVGKFITQSNDYFYAPALSFIYVFFLLTVLLYLYFRQPYSEDPRTAIYHALENLQDFLDDDLHKSNADQIEIQLKRAMDSEQKNIASLANALDIYLRERNVRQTAPEPDIWKRGTMILDAVGLRLGRRKYGTLSLTIIIIWALFVLGFITMLSLSVPTIEPQVILWRGPLIAIQIIVGSLMIIAAVAWLKGYQKRGLDCALAGFVLSLVALQPIYFYLSQFAAISVTLLQLLFLFVLLTYRRWYLSDHRASKG